MKKFQYIYIYILQNKMIVEGVETRGEIGERVECQLGRDGL